MLAAALVFASFAPQSQPDCAPGWLRAFGAPAAMQQLGAVQANAAELADLGNGEELWFGGHFEWHFDLVSPSGFGVLRLTEQGWSSPGKGTTSAVRALRAADLGAGPQMFVGGAFTSIGGIAAARIARWDGQSFQPLAGGFFAGLPGSVDVLEVFDDGSGPSLYAGGTLTFGGPVGGIASWNGAAWSYLSGGTNGPVRALVVHDDGSGPALFVGGTFTEAGGRPAPGLARWQGGAWREISPPCPLGQVHQLAVHDFGSGLELVAARAGAPAGVAPVLRYAGNAWQPIPTGPSGIGSPVSITALASVDDGSGPALWASSSDFPRWRTYRDGDWSAHTVQGTRAVFLRARGPAGRQTLLATGPFFQFGTDTLGSSPLLGVRSPCGESAHVRHIEPCTPTKLRLSAHGPARSGKPLRLGLVALDALWQTRLFVSSGVLGSVAAGGCGMPLPGWGEVLLDGSAHLAEVGAQVLEVAMSSDLLFHGYLDVAHVAIPADPALVGVDLAFQALGHETYFFWTKALSNAVVVTIRP